MSVLRNSYKGIRRERWQWLLDNQPELADRMRREDTDGDYIREWERAYHQRSSELAGYCMEKCGATPELNRKDALAYIRAVERAQEMATEMLRVEMIQTPLAL